MVYNHPDTCTCSPDAMQQMKCLRGEHEAEGIRYLKFVIEVNNAMAEKVFNIGPYCKHCRCLYVEKA